MKRTATLLAILALLAAPLTALAQEEFTAELTSDVEIPEPTLPGGYEGRGTGRVVISADGSEIDYNVQFSGLTGPLTMAHIHHGAAGAAGPPMFWLTDMGDMSGTPSPLTGTLTEADFVAVDGGPQTFAEALDAIRAGNTYINLHTEENAPGEIRGQLTAADLPDSATEGSYFGSLPLIAVLAVAGLAALLFVGRRFATRRA